MRFNGEAAIFRLTAASAAASLVSIVAMEALLAAAVVLWIVLRPAPLRFPGYFAPLVAFMMATGVSLALSPDPGAGWHSIQKFVLFPMGFLAAAFVTSEVRAKHAYRLLLATGTAVGLAAIVQFVFRAIRYSETGSLADDPTLLNRVTGPLGHWMTFSGVMLLVWCAAIPALSVLGRRWIVPAAVAGAAIIASYTRGAWLGAAAGFAFVASTLPRRTLVLVLAPVLIAGIAASPFIYRRIAMSLDRDLATNYSRVHYLSVGTRMIADHPFFGVGPERVHAEFPNYYRGEQLNTFYTGHLHNNFLQIAAERGLVTLAAFVWFLGELYRSLARLLRNGNDEIRWATLGALAALTGFVVAGLTEYNFGDSEVLTLLLFLVSIPFGLSSHVQENPHRQQG